MIEKKCEFCHNIFLSHGSNQRTCSTKCGYAFRSQNQTKWSKEKIIEQIQDIHAQNISLNYNIIKKSKYKFILTTSQSYFGGWKKAIQASGLVSINQSWSKSKIIKQVKFWHKNDQKLNYYAIKKIDTNFVSATERYFSSWDTMLIESGISPQRCYTQWDESKIVKSMIQQYKMGFTMHLNSVRHRDSKLYEAAVSQFGSWKNALKIVDIQPDAIKSKWNKKLVRRWLINMYKKNIPLNSNHIQKNYKNLHAAAVRYFDSWDNALKCSHINPLDVKKTSFWNPELVIQKIKERHKKNKSLYSQDIDKQYSSLKVMGKQYFGSWRKAIEASGIIYKRKTPKLFGEIILGIILSDFFPNKKFIRHCRTLDWLIGIKGHSLELDYYCDDLKLGIEFQGPTHFKPIFGEIELKNQKLRDKRKLTLCIKNGVILIRINYDNFDPETLSSELQDHNIDHIYNKNHHYLCAKYRKKYLRIGD